MPGLLQHTALSSAEPRGDKGPIPSAHTTVLCLTCDNQVLSALRAELLIQLLSFLCCYPHAYIPAFPRVTFSSMK